MRILSDTLLDAYLIVAHFLIALFVVSAGIDVVLRIKPSEHL